MTTDNTATEAERPPDPEIARRRAELDRDDIRTFDVPGNDVSLWPKDWNRAIPARNYGERNPLFVHHDLRRPARDGIPYYRRTKARDAEILASLPDNFETLGVDHRNYLGFHGRPIFVNRRGEEFLLHYFAVLEATARIVKEERQAAEVRRDNTDRRCDACGVTADQTVRPQSLGAWLHRAGSAGPRLCRACGELAPFEMVELWQRRALANATDQTPNGRRIDAVRAWIADNEKRILSA